MQNGKRIQEIFTGTHTVLENQQRWEVPEVKSLFIIDFIMYLMIVMFKGN